MITLTNTASEKAQQLIAEEKGDDELSLRVAVRPGGCSGYSYEMYFDSEKSEDDVVVKYGELEVLSDKMSATLLEGATLDYSDGLMEAGFKIENPNAQRTCGCGNSFS